MASTPQCHKGATMVWRDTKGVYIESKTMDGLQWNIGGGEGRKGSANVGDTGEGANRGDCDEYGRIKQKQYRSNW